MSAPDPIDLARLLGTALQARGWRVTSAESCTGGGIAHAITEIAGSSGWFDQAFVTYSNAAKQKLVGVPAGLLAAHGAVSEPVARAMAEGARAAAEADLAVAVSGIAGPGGAVPGKPVGTVCFAWAGPAGSRSETRHFAGDRAAVRRQSVVHALAGLLAQTQSEQQQG
ncbi:CinA family protein [Chitinimonas koreensis]|uniref:CinA family protein n=1 Tax=Chitinimonas koreensis TaxID=356302 RepID=UPI0003FA17C1|nr:CinA family protein [Chitinimonas koreensis]QNM98093.1 CinA family protein [Chitinimonas koreensis]